MNEELEKKVAEARRVELGTRSLMTRLMSTARKSQETLTKLVSVTLDYYLTMNEKEYLHLLTKVNNDMIERLKDELLNFYYRIFVDSDQDFDMGAQFVIEFVVKRSQDSASISAEPPVSIT